MAVDQRQRQIHVFSEGVALLAVVPLLLKASQATYLTAGQRQGLRTAAVATLVVDGWLLSRWLGG